MKRYLIFLLLSVLLFSSNSKASSSEFERYFKQGNAHFRKKAWDDAIDAYNRAIQINAQVAEVHFNLGMAYFYKRLEIIDKNMQIELYEFFEKAKDPNWKYNGEVINGEDAVTRVLLEKEVQQWKRTIELDDTKSGAHYMLGTHYHNIDNLEEAEKELKRAIELEPEYTNSYGVLASVYEKMGKNDLAIAFHKKDLEIDPEDEGARRDLALLYHKLGMRKEALEQYSILKQKNSVLIDGLKPIFELEE